MKLSALRYALPVVLLSAAATGCFAQTSSSDQPSQTEDLHGLKIHELHPAAMPSPFPLEGVPAADRQRPPVLEFRSPDAMSGPDRELAASAQVEIARRASLQGFHLEPSEGASEAAHGSWGYEQAVCPVFPNHLVLDYSRSNGAGDFTLFSVVVPRGEGHVRVIPVQRRSYSLFTPASSNSLTLNDFNHMVTEEPSGLSPDWLTLGLCYAALAGGHVRAVLRAAIPADEMYPLLRPAQLDVSRKGGAVVHFADATPPKTAARDWTLVFAQNGRLLKVNHEASHGLVEKPIAGSAQEVQGKPTKESAVDLGSNADKPIH